MTARLSNSLAGRFKPPLLAASSRQQGLAVHVLRQPGHAVALLHHPLRLRVLSALLEPDSATGVARRLKLPRQTVNYHVRQLARAHLLARAGRRTRRRMVEQCYVATARGYILSPQLLGSLAADPAQVQDAFSAAYLQSLASRMQSELAYAVDGAAKSGKRLATLSINTQLRFLSPEQRAAFTAALQLAVLSVVEQYSAPFISGVAITATTADTAAGGGENPGEKSAPGRPYRLVLGCYPLPAEDMLPREGPSLTSHSNQTEESSS